MLGHDFFWGVVGVFLHSFILFESFVGVGILYGCWDESIVGVGTSCRCLTCLLVWICHWCGHNTRPLYRNVFLVSAYHAKVKFVMLIPFYFFFLNFFFVYRFRFFLFCLFCLLEFLLLVYFFKRYVLLSAKHLPPSSHNDLVLWETISQKNLFQQTEFFYRQWRLVWYDDKHSLSNIRKGPPHRCSR